MLRQELLLIFRVLRGGEAFEEELEQPWGPILFIQKPAHAWRKKKPVLRPAYNLEPTSRIELLTSSLPRTRSAN